ncbi:Phage integrase family protein [Marinobacterium sp. xm-d-543]|uniref:tyrosine-type recombinase/integrase n=1 Tax=Marinobacterium sp. xm-d-543 TaxID=2497740 RepID=UPI00156A248A|nr:tyrosine-type recombinase/integrase [Marinobacterium sp. xm-d-543]NRP47540.1 Phage integrase family protein [Marinobacterium sp. xm-d-543]
MMKNLRISKTGYWQLRMVIPSDVRQSIGKREFKKSLGQLSKHEAEIQANLLLAKWKNVILHHRQSTNIKLHSSDVNDLSDLNFSDEQKERIKNQTKQDLERLAGLPEASNQDIVNQIVDRLEVDRSIETNPDSVGAYFGIYCKPSSYVEQYRLERLTGAMSQRSEDEHLGVINNQFVKAFPIIDENFTKKKVQEWWDSFRTSNKPPAPSTLRKYKSHCTAYMKWLRRKELTNRPNFFDELEPITKKEASRRRVLPKRKAFSSSDIKAIWESMLFAKKQDTALQELFLMALYTGCRIEELCQLHANDIHQLNNGRFYIDIPVSKTERGEDRQVPVHKVIEPIIVKKNEFLIDVGNVNNKYKERSSAIGKRFSRLKMKLGFGPEKVFHSTRKTFIDKLKENGTQEQFAADIVGHEIHTMTYGVYASGAPVSVLFEHVDAIKYSELES